jgi:hypothetical protein
MAKEIRPEIYSMLDKLCKDVLQQCSAVVIASIGHVLLKREAHINNIFNTSQKHIPLFITGFNQLIQQRARLSSQISNESPSLNKLSSTNPEKPTPFI